MVGEKERVGRGVQTDFFFFFNLKLWNQLDNKQYTKVPLMTNIRRYLNLKLFKLIER